MAAFWLDTLAEFLVDFRFDSLKSGTVEQASYVILDTMGAIAGGAAEPEMQALTAKLTVSPVGEASVIGTDRKAGSAAAAFLNGTAGTFLEMDEGNRFAKGHPSIHVLPALWALAEIRGLSGKADERVGADVMRHLEGFPACVQEISLECLARGEGHGV